MNKAMAGKKRYKRTCSKCGSSNIARYEYGLPSDDALEKTRNNNKIIWAGCCIYSDSPKYHCNDCGVDFDENMNIWEKKETPAPIIKKDFKPKTKNEIFRDQLLRRCQDYIGLIAIIVFIELVIWWFN